MLICLWFAGPFHCIFPRIHPPPRIQLLFCLSVTQPLNAKANMPHNLRECNWILRPTKLHSFPLYPSYPSCNGSFYQFLLDSTMLIVVWGVSSSFCLPFAYSSIPCFSYCSLHFTASVYLNSYSLFDSFFFFLHSYSVLPSLHLFGLQLPFSLQHKLQKPYSRENGGNVSEVSDFTR